jgi:GNAT superfamily N-acetyltransferase
LSEFAIRPLTPDLWPALEDLFGPSGASNGCWCMWWRIGRDYTRIGRDKARAAFRRVVKKGPPPGLLAFDGELAVGWCQLTPRSALPHLERSQIFAAVDDRPVWSVSCFYIRRGHRGQGVMTALVEAAVQHAKRAGAPALEAYPWDSGQKRTSASVYTGMSSTFARAGFREVARRKADRPIMRYELAPRGRKKAS